MDITSTAFVQGAPIPRRFTCDGEDLSPPLTFAAVPTNAKTLVLILEDPDAPGGTWVHWTFWDLPAAQQMVPEHANITALGGHEGTTSAKTTGYHGPCPPGGTHRYFFRLYAIGQVLRLAAGAPAKTLREAMAGHVVAEAHLMGTYGR